MVWKVIHGDEADGRRGLALQVLEVDVSTGLSGVLLHFRPFCDWVAVFACSHQLLNLVHGIQKSFFEFLKVFTIQEDFVLLVVHTSIVFKSPLALCDGHVQIFSPCCLHIEEIRPLACPNGFGVELLLVVVITHLSMVYREDIGRELAVQISICSRILASCAYSEPVDYLNSRTLPLWISGLRRSSSMRKTQE